MIKTPVDGTSFPTSFGTIIISKSDNGIILRNTCKSESEIKSWLIQYEEQTKTNWIVKYELKDPEKLMLHKTWACHHSQKNKLSLKYKNTGCKCTLDVKIKKVNRNTRRNDELLQRSKPLCCIIKIGSFHNHHIGIPSALKYLRLSKDVVNTFQEYFSMSMTSTTAARHHENLLLVKEQEDGKIYTDDASLNPKFDSVAHIYKEWKKNQFGIDNNSSPLNSLKERLEELRSKGSEIGFREDGELWAAYVVTPVMKRNQHEKSSTEGVFVDSSASCDVLQSNITVMFTVTKAGAVPIGILIHSHQSLESYKQAFSLFHDECPKAFGGEESPQTMMTDDSSAERAALKEIWPQAILLLCHFHFLQAEWRWLLSNYNKNERPELIQLFKTVLYADTQSKFEEAKKAIDDLETKYPKFHKRFHQQLERKEDWVLLYRLPLLTRNNNTNNYSEASIRILKDVVLNRTKAFNVVALVMFFIDVWDPYFVARLSKLAFGRGAAQVLLYDKLYKSASYLNGCEVMQISDIEYTVPASDNIKTYTVNIGIGQCSCYSGRQGSFCKHQCWLMSHLKISLPNSPTITTDDRWLLGKLARGDDCPERNYFLGLQEQESSSPAVENMEASTLSENEISVWNFRNEDVNEAMHCVVEEQRDQEEMLFSQASIEFARILALTKNHESTVPIAKNMILSLQKIKTPNQAISTLLALKNSVRSTVRRGGKIRVQPTSISRRRKGLPRGSKPVLRGRPSALEVQRQRRMKKRPRNLSQAIKDNVANAKSH